MGRHIVIPSPSVQSSKDQNQLQRLVRKAPKAVLLVKRRCLGVFGVYEQCMDTDMFKDQSGATDGVHQQQLPQSLPLKIPVHRQAPKANARNLPGKPLR